MLVASGSTTLPRLHPTRRIDVARRLSARLRDAEIIERHGRRVMADQGSPAGWVVWLLRSRRHGSTGIRILRARYYSAYEHTF